MVLFIALQESPGKLHFQNIHFIAKLCTEILFVKFLLKFFELYWNKDLILFGLIYKVKFVRVGNGAESFLQ